MKLLLDQDVYAVTAKFLHDLGYDIVTASELGLSRAEDETLLREAQKQGRIFVTRDRDFGNLVFVHQIGAGVIYLRMLPSTAISVHKELEAIFKRYSEEELSSAFVVVEPKGHRIRKIK